jgi:hypothetical protein
MRIRDEILEGMSHSKKLTSICILLTSFRNYLLINLVVWVGERQEGRRLRGGFLVMLGVDANRVRSEFRVANASSAEKIMGGARP